MHAETLPSRQMLVHAGCGGSTARRLQAASRLALGGDCVSSAAAGTGI